MKRWLYDTSVFTALEDDRPLKDLPTGEIGVSVITLGELALGLHLLGPERLPHRVETIGEIEHSWSPIPVSAEIVRRFGSMVASARRAGIKPDVADAIIAATASFHGLAVVTQDRDFLKFDGLDVVMV